MNEPIPNHSEGEPASAATRAAEEGCLKPVLTGCGALTLILGIAVLVFVVKADDLLRWTLEKVEVQIVEALPDEIDEATRERLDEAFVVSREALVTGQLDALDLQSFRAALLDYSAAASRGLTLEDVDRLIRSLERLGGEDGELPRDSEPLVEPQQTISPPRPLAAV